jgi:glycosyltransferase involved in cell wall biosynthesis
MLVTVIIPTYNRVAFLLEAVASVLAQSYEHFELVIADDGSDDGTEEAVRQLDDERVVYQRSPQNRGQFRNIMEATRRATGELVAHLHDDNRWKPDLLATLVPPLVEDPRLALAFSDHHIIDASGTVDHERSDRISRMWQRDTLEGGIHEPFCEIAIVRQAIPISCACVFRASAIDWDDFPPETNTVYDLWLCYLACRDGRGAYYHQGRLADYREHAGAETLTGRLGMSRASVFAWSRFLEDPRLTALGEPIRRGLAKALASYGGALVDNGDVSGGRRALRRAFGTHPSPRVAAAFAATWIAPRASRRAVRAARSRSRL